MGNIKKARQQKKKARMRNFGAAVVSVMLVMAMVIGLMPSSAMAAVSDKDTSTKYTESLGDNASTEYAGRVWTDKSVYSGDATFETYGGGSVTIGINENGVTDEDFLVAYSALATGQEIKGQTTTPIDVVFVIDMSGSMFDNSMSGGGTRLQNAINALNESAETLLSLNDYVRIGVVGYHASATEILPLDHYEKIRNNNFFTHVAASGNTNPGIRVSARGSDGTDFTGTTRCVRGTNIQKGIF